MPVVLQGWGSPFAPIPQGYSSAAALGPDSSIILQGMGAPQRLLSAGYSSAPAPAPQPSIILQGMGAAQRLLTEGYRSHRRHPVGKNPSPQPHTDLVQLLLGVLSYQDDPDITQAVLTDYQSTEAEALTLGEVPTTRGRTAGTDAYDDGLAEWGYAQYD